MRRFPVVIPIRFIDRSIHTGVSMGILAKSIIAPEEITVADINDRAMLTRRLVRVRKAETIPVSAFPRLQLSVRPVRGEHFNL